MDLKKPIQFDFKGLINGDTKVPLAVLMVTVTISLLLVYLIFGVYDNYQVHASSQARYESLLQEKQSVNDRLVSFQKKNQAYIGYLNRAPKSKSELASMLTSIIAQHSLKLTKFSLNEATQNTKDAAILVEAEGRFEGVAGLTKSLAPALASSEVQSIKISKLRDKPLLHVTLAIKFNKPPQLSANPVKVNLGQLEYSTDSALFEGWKVIATELPLKSEEKITNKPTEPSFKRDPFQPLSSGIVDNKSTPEMKPVQPASSYLLAGVLQSNKSNLCVLNLSAGGYKTFAVGQKIDSDLTIEKIEKTSIVTYSKKSRKHSTIHVGEEIL